MQTSRKQIYQVLFDLVSDNLPAAFVTKSRELRDVTDVAFEELPAFFQTQVEEPVEYVKGNPPTFSMSVDLYFYADKGTNSEPIAADVLNDAADAVEAALSPGVCGMAQTLGGLVSHAGLESFQYFEALTSTRMILLARVKMLGIGVR